MSTNHKKLIVFDTDGVIFKSQFLLYLSWKSGKLNYVRALYFCFLFSINYINIRDLLERVYINVKGLKEEDLWRIYFKTAMVKYANETIRNIIKRGHYVALVSSGVPDILMKDMAVRLNADCGHGIDIVINNGVCTGEIGGQLFL